MAEAVGVPEPNDLDGFGAADKENAGAKERDDFGPDRDEAAEDEDEEDIFQLKLLDELLFGESVRCLFGAEAVGFFHLGIFFLAGSFFHQPLSCGAVRVFSFEICLFQEVSFCRDARAAREGGPGIPPGQGVWGGARGGGRGVTPRPGGVGGAASLRL